MSLEALGDPPRRGVSVPAPSPLSLSLSTGPACPSITTDIDLDNRASGEPIITGSFNQLVSILLLFSLCWAGMLTWREEGQAGRKELQGSIVLGRVSSTRGLGPPCTRRRQSPPASGPRRAFRHAAPKPRWASSVLPASRNHMGPCPAVPVLGRVQPQHLCPCYALIRAHPPLPKESYASSKLQHK